MDVLAVFLSQFDQQHVEMWAINFQLVLLILGRTNVAQSSTGVIPFKLNTEETLKAVFAQ